MRACVKAVLTGLAQVFLIRGGVAQLVRAHDS